MFAPVVQLQHNVPLSDLIQLTQSTKLDVVPKVEARWPDQTSELHKELEFAVKSLFNSLLHLLCHQYASKKYS